MSKIDESLEIRLETDFEGLKKFEDAHKRHKQYGPDVLTMSAQGRDLSFKTTFTPEPGGGQRLQCIIAGKKATVVPPFDFTPEKWHDFAESLNVRNKHNEVLKYVKNLLEQQQAKSEKAYKEYELSKDPDIVIRFINDDFSGEVIKEPWVIDIIAEWKRENRRDLLDKIFHPQGRPKIPHSEELKHLLFVDRIDRARANGEALQAALIEEIEKTKSDGLGGTDLYKEIEKMKRRYNYYKKKQTIVWASEKVDHYEVRGYGNKVAIGKDYGGRGDWKIIIPKK